MRRKRVSACSSLWSNADETAAVLEKSETPVLVARKPDPRADLDARPCATALQPQHGAGAKIGARESGPDAESRAQPSRATRQRRLFHRRIIAPHERQPFERLEGTDQHRAAGARGLGRQVEV